MSETEFLIGRSNLNLADGFYPEDLPSEWRFEYYATQFRALCLPIDTQEDLESIFEELEDSDEEFELILSIDTQLIAEYKKLSALLSVIEPYKSLFVLFCELEQSPSDKVAALLKDFHISFQSNNNLNLDLPAKEVAGKYLYFNRIPVLYSQHDWDEKQTKEYVQQASVVNTRTILICQNAESESLNKIRIVSEILGF
jgi:hypothetical protein